MVRIIVSVGGGEADKHEIPAYEGSQSIYGIARSILIVGNLLSEGKLRKKDFDHNKCKINLGAPRPGSFVLEFIATYPVASSILAATSGMIVSGVVGNFAYDILKNSYKRLTGEPTNDNPTIEAALDATNTSTERLLEALEPSVRIAHNMINNGVVNINISTPTEKENVALNSRTKSFVWKSIIDKNVKIQLFSVSKFDPNSRNWTLFDFEERRPVSFQAEKNIDEQSVESIIWSQSEYTRKRLLLKKTDTSVAFKFTSLNAQDGRAKKIFVEKVRRNISEL